MGVAEQWPDTRVRTTKRLVVLGLLVSLLVGLFILSLKQPGEATEQVAIKGKPTTLQAEQDGKVTAQEQAGKATEQAATKRRPVLQITVTPVMPPTIGPSRTATIVISVTTSALATATPGRKDLMPPTAGLSMNGTAQVAAVTSALAVTQTVAVQEESGPTIVPEASPSETGTAQTGQSVITEAIPPGSLPLTGFKDGPESTELLWIALGVVILLVGGGLIRMKDKIGDRD